MQAGIPHLLLFCFAVVIPVRHTSAVDLIQAEADIQQVSISPNGRYAACLLAGTSDMVVYDIAKKTAVARLTQATTAFDFDTRHLFVVRANQIEAYTLDSMTDAASAPSPVATKPVTFNASSLLAVGDLGSSEFVASEIYLSAETPVSNDKPIRFGAPQLQPLPRRIPDMPAYLPQRRPHKAMWTADGWLLDGAIFRDLDATASALLFVEENSPTLHPYHNKFRIGQPQIPVAFNQNVGLPIQGIPAVLKVQPSGNKVTATICDMAGNSILDSHTWDGIKDSGYHKSRSADATRHAIAVAVGPFLLTHRPELPDEIPEPLRIVRAFPPIIKYTENLAPNVEVSGGRPPYTITVNGKEPGTELFTDTHNFLGRLKKIAPGEKPPQQEKLKQNNNAFESITGRSVDGFVDWISATVQVKDNAGNSVQSRFATGVEISPEIWAPLYAEVKKTRAGYVEQQKQRADERHSQLVAEKEQATVARQAKAAKLAAKAFPFAGSDPSKKPPMSTALLVLLPFFVIGLLINGVALKLADGFELSWFPSNFEAFSTMQLLVAAKVITTASIMCVLGLGYFGRFAGYNFLSLRTVGAVSACGWLMATCGIVAAIPVLLKIYKNDSWARTLRLSGALVVIQTVIFFALASTIGMLTNG